MSHHRDSCRQAAHKICERLDDDITPETIFWRSLFERCKRVAAAEEQRMKDETKSRRCGVGAIRECSTKLVPPVSDGGKNK